MPLESRETAPSDLNPALRALEDVARAEGWTFTPLDPYSRQLVRVEKDLACFFAGIGRVQNFPLNSAVSASIARDKAFTYEVVAAAGIDVPPYGHFFLNPAQAPLRGRGREREDAFPFARALGYPVFVKPIDGSRGALADIAYDAHDLDALLTAIARLHHAALVQPVLSGEDRRIFILDGTAMFTYRRLRSAVSGDGETPLGPLLAHYNAAAVGIGISAIPETSPFLREALAARGLTLDSILAPGETFTFAARGNVSAGGAIADYSEEMPKEWADWAARVTDALALRVAAVDFFAPAPDAPAASLQLIEVNSNPNLSGIIALGHANRARDIWRRVGTTFFAEQARRDP